MGISTPAAPKYFKLEEGRRKREGERDGGVTVQVDFPYYLICIYNIVKTHVYFFGGEHNGDFYSPRLNGF